MSTDDGPLYEILYDQPDDGPDPRPLYTKRLPPRDPHVFCACGRSILFGPLATDEMRANPTCSECETTLDALRRLAEDK